MSADPLLENRRASWVRYFVLAWLCGAAALAYVPRNLISVAEMPMREDLGLTKKEMGWTLSAFFLSYAILQIPSGWISQRWGSRAALSVFSLLGSLTSAHVATAIGVWSLAFARFNMGVAQAGLFPAATNTLMRWFPASRRGVASGLLTCFMSIGGGLGSILTGYLLDLTTWQTIFLLCAVPTMIWAIGFWWWFRDLPEEHSSVNQAELDFIRQREADRVANPAPEPVPAIPWRSILTSSAMYWIAAQQFFRAAGYVFFTTWFATYLRETREVGNVLAGILNSIPIFGVVLGSFTGGYVSDWLLARTGSRRVARQALASSMHFICAALIFIGYQIPDAWWAVLVISVAATIGSIAAPCAYAITMDMGGKYITGVFSLMNMSGNLGAWLFPLAVPWILGDENNWDRVMLVFAGIYFAAAVCWIPFNANGTIVNEDHARPQAAV